MGSIPQIFIPALQHAPDGLSCARFAPTDGLTQCGGRADSIGLPLAVVSRRSYGKKLGSMPALGSYQLFLFGALAGRHFFVAAGHTQRADRTAFGSRTIRTAPIPSPASATLHQKLQRSAGMYLPSPQFCRVLPASWPPFRRRRCTPDIPHRRQTNGPNGGIPTLHLHWCRVRSLL